MTAHAERSRPLRADAERNRRRILTAAREVFARRGLDAGLDEIARHAGVGTGTVYRRFPEKSLLIEALFEDRLDQMLALVEGAATHPDPWEGLVEILESVTKMQIEDRGLKDVIFSGVGDKEVFRERRERFLPLVEQVDGPREGRRGAPRGRRAHRPRRAAGHADDGGRLQPRPPGRRCGAATCRSCSTASAPTAPDRPHFRSRH